MKLYSELAEWWHLLSRPVDYAEEAGLFRDIIYQHKPDVVNALELGCGGGNNAFHLKTYYELVLTDISPAMLEVSQKINPECDHYQGDMRSLQLPRKFDLVYVHDAIMFMTTEQDLTRVFKTADEHLTDDGLLFIAPDYFRETFKPSTSHGGHDKGTKGLRYLEWMYDSDPLDTWVDVEYAYLLREGDQVKCVNDHFNAGLFPRATWKYLLEQAGFEVTFEPIAHSELPAEAYIGIVAVKSS